MDWVERKRGQFFRYAEIRHIQISDQIVQIRFHTYHIDIYIYIVLI